MNKIVSQGFLLGQGKFSRKNNDLRVSVTIDVYTTDILRQRTEVACRKAVHLILTVHVDRCCFIDTA